MTISRILVTGASGFLGAGVLRTLAGTMDLTGVYHAHPLEVPGARLVCCDITDAGALDSLLDEARPEVVLHLAAFTRVDEGEGARERVARVNEEATGRLAALCAERGVRLLYVSTDLVYGAGEGPHGEDGEAAPLSHYARTKLEGERLVREAGGDFVICRTAILYGPAGPASHSFSDWLHQRFGAGETVPLYRDQYRSFLYTVDAALALAEIAERAPSGWTVNVGGPKRMDRLTFGEAFARAFGYDASLIRPISIHEDGRGRLRGPDCSLDTSRLCALVTRPPRPVDEALAHWRAGRT